MEPDKDENPQYLSSSFKLMLFGIKHLLDEFSVMTELMIVMNDRGFSLSFDVANTVYAQLASFTPRRIVLKSKILP